jgi:1-hydroxy-2-methyl-2-(E)-butenyl 4-diphosphate synthase
MELYTESLTTYKRLPTKEVKIGHLLLGNFHPLRIQTMTTTDTMDTHATVAQSIRCIEAGAELVRITAPSKKEAENLLNIKNELRRRGYDTPLVADIHFTPNAAEIAARIVEKVRVNPGNYVDKKRFELIEYSDADYAEEIDRIRERFTPLVKICREYGTAMRIGTNHGSLSDRIMSRYGDTPMGMVESAMEFLRIARAESYHNIVLSMKSSNPQVMVQAYRLLVKTMHDEFGEHYPLHLGVTEAGDGEEGRIKSAVGIGSLLEDGLGDTIRVSLTEDPELEIPVCRDIVKRYVPSATVTGPSPTVTPFSGERAKAPSRWEGEGNSVVLIDEDVDLLEEETVGYRFADPFFYKLIKQYAKEHRSKPTATEEILWNALKAKQLEGYKFRRQHIIDKFIADFVCLKKSLVIEIDGLIHFHPDHIISDEERTKVLNHLGFKVIRFSNKEIINRIDIVLKKILTELSQQPDLKESSNPGSPTGGQGATLNNGGIATYKQLQPDKQEGLTLVPPSQFPTDSPTGGQGATSNSSGIATYASQIPAGTTGFPFSYKRRETFAVDIIGGNHVPVVIADLSQLNVVSRKDLSGIGYTYDEVRDKWNISDTAADFVFTGHNLLDFELPGTLKVIMYPAAWLDAKNKTKYFPIYDDKGYTEASFKSSELNFVMLDASRENQELPVHPYLDEMANDPKVVFCISSKDKNAMQSVRHSFLQFGIDGIKNPAVLVVDSNWLTADEHLIHYGTEAGALLLDGFGDGISLGMTVDAYKNASGNVSAVSVSGRNYSVAVSPEQFINNTAFSILQATRTRISKTEYISCPSCGRTLFDLQETTAKIRAVTNHLKGVKIAIMGCIVNGPGEMADADFGYVGSGPGKITLYKGKEIVKRNVPSEIAVDELINVMKENGAWVEESIVNSEW